MTRFGRFKQLQRFDEISTAMVENFRNELWQSSAKPRARALVMTAIRFARGKPVGVKTVESLFGLDWQKLFPADQLRAARKALARAVESS